MKRIIAALAVMMVIGFIASCRKENLEIEATGIELRKSLLLDVDDTFRLTATILPENVTHRPEVVWTSSDPDVLAVDEEGNLTPLAQGEAVVTAALREKPSIEAGCRVTVDEGVVTFGDDTFFASMLRYDTNNDGKLQKSEAQAVVGEIVVSGMGIKSLRGIEYFVNLEALNCSANSLTELDLSKNVALKELLCHHNMLETLDLGALKKLERLICRSNRLSGIDVTNNPELVWLDCGQNDGGMSDHDGIREVDVSKNPKLEYLSVYYLHLSKLDVTHNPLLRELNFAYCCHTMWDTFTPIEEIDLSQNPLLEVLSCGSSNVEGFGLNALDVSSNPKLRELSTFGNPKITKLDLSRNPELEYLVCSHNSLAALDVTGCPKLKSLSCDWNRLTALNLTGSSALEYLNCANNGIGKLDLGATKLYYLLAENNRISRIDLGDKTFDTKYPVGGGSGTTSMSGQPYLYMKLNDNLIEEVDLGRQTYLRWLEISRNRLASLDLRGCPNLGGLHCDGNQLTELLLAEDGNNHMYHLYFNDNLLSGTFDVSWMDATFLAAEDNDLDYIKVWRGFDPNSTTLYNGKTLPCYTKDEDTEWLY